jgi:NADH:ubiquinone oxidoreductase subunit 4 (subunit M)
MSDMNLRETIAFMPLLVMIVVIGVWPYPVMTKAQNAVAQLTSLAAGTQVQTLPQTITTTPIGGADGH